jgi:hypothetical protein
MAQELWTVNRGGYDARVVRLSPFDQLTHDGAPVFTERELAEEFCYWFNEAQKAAGAPLSIPGIYQGYLLAAA